MNVVACVPYFGPKDLAHDACIRELRKIVNVCEVYDIPWIDQARSALVSHALVVGKAEVIVFIDHDILFDPADVLKIAALAIEHDVVAAAYSRKRHGSPLVGAFAPEVKQVTFFKGGGIYPATLVGLGFCAISARAIGLLDGLPLLRMAGGEMVRPYFLPLAVGGFYLGEDAAFCMRMAAAGAKLNIDTTIRVRHRGSYAYTIEDSARPLDDVESVIVDLIPA